MTWWQSLPEHINPNLLEIGSFQLRYYGLMYLVAFGLVYFLVAYRIKKEHYPFNLAIFQDYFIWGILGIILGGRLGYVLIYQFDYYASHPLEIFLPFQFAGGFRFTGIAGMSYHGGLLGFIAATVLFCRKYKISLWSLVDLPAPAVPLAYAFGRLGNFINGELYGRATDLPWGMYFPSDPEGLLRHPSQLYQAFFEGICLFVLLWALRKRNWVKGSLAALYLISYGVVRFGLEFFREPDSHLGFVLGNLSMGQILCLLMIITGGVIWIMRSKSEIGTDRQSRAKSN